MKKFVIILTVCGFLGSGCVNRQITIPPRPILNESRITNGELVLSPRDKTALLIYITHIEEIIKDG